jgi:DNA polymerase-3 subunit delta'
MADFLAAAMPDSSAGARGALALLAAGSPGRAIAYADMDVDELARLLDRVEAGGGQAGGGAMRLVDLLGRKEAAERFDVAVELIVRRIAASARQAAGSGHEASRVAAWSEAGQLAARARSQSLDKGAVLLRLCGLLADGAAHRDGRV